MNFLKSVFITAFLAWLAGLSLYALGRLAQGAEPLLAWLGLGLSSFPLLVFFIASRYSRSPRNHPHPVEYSVLGGLGLALTMAMSFRYGPAAGQVHAWAGITLAGWLLYLRWYSALPASAAAALKAGGALPDFRLESLDGHLVSSESFRAKPHLLVFYHGNWCPFCIAQVRELAGLARELEQAGAGVVLISPQTARHSQALAARFDAPLLFLRDPRGAAASRLGILHRWGTPLGLQLLGHPSDTVLPTVVLTDARGRVVFSEQAANCRLRPRAPTLLAILQNTLAQHRA